MSGRVELEARHENPAAISRVVCASDLERPPGTPTLAAGDESPMNSRKRRVQGAFQGSGLLSAPLPHERSSQPHERTGARPNDRKKGEPFSASRPPTPSGDQSRKGATTVEQELTDVRTLRAATHEA
jgi:hypothetical protein